MAETADIGKQQVATVYAKALLGASANAGNTDAVVDELGSLVNDVLLKHPGFESTIGSPRLSPEEKMSMLDRVFGSRGSEQLQTFLKVLCQHERLDCLREVHTEAERLLNEQRGKAQVEITTAHGLSEQEKQKIISELQVKMGRDIEMTHKIDENIIGGIVVRVGDTVVDGSVRNRLHKMKAQAVKRVVEQIHEGSNDRFAST